MTFAKRNPRTPIQINDPSMTEQCHKDEVKIQNIIHKHKTKGILTHVNEYKGTYGDFANAADFHQAQNVIAEAMSMFETVPATIRAVFDNDPARFLDFMQNQENIESIEEMGLDASHLKFGECSEPTPNELALSTLKSIDEKMNPRDGDGSAKQTPSTDAD